ncbi:MAG: hypothetical protein JXQ26_10265 [Tissierellales bacterium]|nr:hypothetical protein [Tissierellales bacterium]MBN2828367.1 hypothetical protein [Tissierellales bacterium]
MVKYFLTRSLEENKIIRIIYDSKGKITERDIRVIAIHDQQITAFCYLRNQKRNFMIANILAVDFIKEE